LKIVDHDAISLNVTYAPPSSPWIIRFGFFGSLQRSWLSGGQDARVLWPNSITFTKDNKVVCKAYCTMRREWKTFRIDRMLTCHELTTPDDIEVA